MNWQKLLVAILIAFVSGGGLMALLKKGQTPEPLPPIQGGQPIDSVRVIVDTTILVDTLPPDTVYKTAPDTCHYWVDHYKRLSDSLRTLVGVLQAKSRGGTLHFTDKTYKQLILRGSLTYPEGGSSIEYQWLQVPYFHKPRFSVGAGLPFFDFPYAEISMRWKKTDHWFGVTIQPQFDENDFKTRFGATWRWMF